MGSYQKFRGNPEQKLFYLLHNFMGGINTEFSDDSSSDVDFESIINFDMDKLGTLNKRGGFGELIAISEIFNKLDTATELPNIKNRTEETPNPENENDNIVYMKLLRNDNNCFRALSGFTGENAYRKYQQMYGFQDNKFTLLVITTRKYSLNSISTAWLYKCELPELEYEDGEPTDVETMTINCYKTTLPVIFNWDRNLLNLDTIEFYDKIHFTGNDRCLVTFDRSVEVNSNANLASAFTYSGWGSVLDSVTNNAHLPSGLEVRHIGFNVLADNPMQDINTTGLSTDSIQGVFVCTNDNIPLLSLPLGQPFLLNIIYTGQSSDFTIEIKEGDKALTFTKTVNSTHTRTGLKSYNITFNDVPSGEVEIKIVKDTLASGAALEPYYDYYNVEQVDKELKPVTHLNIGDYGICEMYNRAVYYKDDTMWFSDVNNFSYIPNYNYVTLPIEPTDKITKICYFKKAYIIFTKQRIYKMTGSFGTSDFAVSPVNMSLGCHAGNTIVPIEDTLYFASPRGLYALRSSQFVEGYENVKELDLKVKKLTNNFTKYSEELSSPAVRFNGINERAYALRYKDKYLLFYNNYNDKGDYAAMNGLDVLTYQFDIGAYTTYRFKEKPTFLFMVDNAIETFSTVKQKEEYSAENVVFNYDFVNNISNGIVTDSTNNHNDGTLKGNYFTNKGEGLIFDGINDKVKINNFNGDIENGFNIKIETELSELNGATLLALQQSQPTVDKITGSFETNVNDNIYFKFDYEITPNPITLNDTVSYKLYAKRNLTTAAGGTISYKVTPLINSNRNISFIFGIGSNSRLIDSGTATFSRNSDGTYNNIWNFVGTLTTTNRSYNVTGAKTISLQSAKYIVSEIVLKQDGNKDKLKLILTDNLETEEIATGENIGLLGRHVWEIVYRKRENLGDFQVTIYRDNTYLSGLSGPINEFFSNINRDLCYIGTDKTESSFLKGNVYSLDIYNSNKTLLKYDFSEGSGTTIIDKSENKTPAVITGCTWITEQGLRLEGSGYVELPEFRDTYFANGFEIEFSGILSGNTEIARLIDLAVVYNNDNVTDKDCSINIGINNSTISLNSTSKSCKSYKIQNSTIDFTQNHIYKMKCLDNGNGYTLSITVDGTVVSQDNFEYGGIENIVRLSNFIGKSNTTTEKGVNAFLKTFKLTIYESSSPIPVYRTAVYEFDTTTTDFGKPMYLELKTKGINMNYPQHLKKLKHIFVKAIGGYTYGELFFTLFGDGYIVNDPGKYSYYLDEEGTVVQDYEDIKDLKIDERISLLGNMRLNKTKLGEGTYQLRKLIIPKKCKNFTLLIYGENSDYISFESFGFVVKLGKVKEG